MPEKGAHRTDQISQYSRHILLLDEFGLLGRRKLLSSSVLVVGSGGIGSILLPFLAVSNVGRITVVNHNDTEVYNLRRQVIHTEGRRVMSKARSARDAMTALNRTASVTAVTEPLTWYNAMVLLRGSNCVVDTRDNPCTWYLINEACVLAGRELKTAAMTNGVNGRGGIPIPLVSGSAMSTGGQLKVYSHQGEGRGATDAYTPRPTLWE